VAIIIDWVIVWIAITILFLPFAVLSYYSGRGAFWGVGSLLPFAIFFIYILILEGVKGKTIGKHLLHLQVVTVDGGPIDISKAIVRNISKINGILLLLDWIVGIATDGDPRQRFMDRIAGTLVIKMDVPEQIQGAYPPASAIPIRGHRRPPPHRPRH
jgi:uncharacterized RDD family membrane protein YckC